MDRLGKLKMDQVKERLFKILEMLLPYTLYMYIRALYCRITTKDKTKLYCNAYFYKYRPFSRKKYYIIRFPQPAYALFAAGRGYIFAAEYATSKGMIPLIDIEYEDDFEKGILGKKNLWDGFFCQKSIKDILKEDATILVSAFDRNNIFLPETCIDINNCPTDYYIHTIEENWKNYYKGVNKYIQKYWGFREEFLYDLELKWKEICGDEKNILGISLREEFSKEFFLQLESDEARAVYKEHPLGPDIGEIIEIVEDYLENWKCGKIFLATVFKESIEIFEKRFPGRIVYLDRIRDTMQEKIARLSKTWKEKASGKINKTYDQIDKINYQYTQETVLLSKCTYLIGAKSGATIAALAMNGGRYKDIKILEDKRNITRY